MESGPLPPVPPSAFRRRREAAFDRLGGGVLVLRAASVQYTSRDTERPYCPDRELYYLTGLTEPETVAVLLGGTERRVVIFVRDRDPDAELWAGPRMGVDGAKDAVPEADCHALAELDVRLAELLDASDHVYFRLGRRDAVETAVLEALRRARARGPRRGDGPRSVVDPGEVLDDLRLVKDAHELDRLRRACDVTVLGHRCGVERIVPGGGEWAVEASINGAFRAAGGRGPGFGTIVGSGANGCVLHYVENGDTIQRGHLVLVDAGAEVGLYHGDVTRTWPASGRFSDEQRAIYEIVDGARVCGAKIRTFQHNCSTALESVLKTDASP